MIKNHKTEHRIKKTGFGPFVAGPIDWLRLYLHDEAELFTLMIFANKRSLKLRPHFAKIAFQSAKYKMKGAV